MVDLPPFDDPRLDVLRGGLYRWANDRIEPGSFLRAVLQNDLRGACEKADDYNRMHLYDVVSYCYQHMPSGSWGSLNNYNTWRLSDVS